MPLKGSLTKLTKAIGLVGLVILMLVLVGCDGAGAPVPLPTYTPLPPKQPTQPSPSPTNIPEPTAVPPSPTTTLEPADSPTPTPTPAPTDTPIPPTQTPTPAATLTPEVALTSIEAITAQRLGEVVSVEGAVVDARSFSQGFAFTLDDGTGQVELLMWHDVYDECWDAAEINRGATVRATGEVGQYEGVLQIEPDFGGDVKALTAADTVTAPRREIGSLTGGDEGQRVTIEGDVVRVEGGGSWVKVFVGDGTGEVLVFLYRNVLDRVPDNTALGTPGSRVRVVGPVAVYEGNLEIVPVLPYDVMVLSE